ncbi:DUF6644 family protein [Sphingobium subterraneum]|uniref:DUF6644 domain-containing protein n=1 Tax=Sphingobium subterraneum TaxID=627688 RepID=A0A841IWV0_9SPHN|nr:DUF6644 family protein [Sphingobium subterraneum]MBB6123419.1 hypothetical protein [Sphingobium subterraneum]
MLAEFATWISTTSLSETFKNVSWLVPLSQSIHILSIAAVLSAYLFLCARALGVFAANQSMLTLERRFLPWVWYGLLLLLVTGCLQIIAEPERSITNPFFQYKMLALLVVIVITLPLRRKIAEVGANDTPGPIVTAPLLAIFGLLLFIIFCGRWIAYSAYS